MNLTSAEYKEIARDALKEKRFEATISFLLAALLGAFCTSAYFICQFAAAMGVSIRFFEGVPHFLSFLLVMGIILALFYFFVGGAIRFGYIDYNLALLDRRRTEIFRLFGKFTMFWKALYMRVIVLICEFLYSLLLIVPGIIAVYSYAMVPYILEEKPNYSVGRAMRTSKKIMKGHKVSDETKRKMSDSRKGNKNHRCVAIYCPELDETFWGAKEAADKYGFNRNHITNCANGKLKHTGKHPVTGVPLSWIKVESKNY